MNVDDPDAVTDADTRAAVLSGMLSPFQQGNAGSCFATGPARRQRIEKPILMMENMAEIATTGQFTSPALSAPLPANENLPAGENPLMRSFESTLAAGSAMLTSSREHAKLNNGLWDAGNAGLGLGDLEGVVGNDTWNGSTELDENDDLVDEGMNVRLRRAIQQQLRFDYNALELDTSDGGGDGNSSRGVFEIVYQGSAIKSEDAFQDAVEAIALAAAETDDATVVQAIKDLIQNDRFVDAIYASYGTSRTEAPWNLEGGGYSDQPQRALTGVPMRSGRVIARDDRADPGDQARAVLDSLVTGMGGQHGLVGLTTHGENAHHAFMGTPDHPTFQAISGTNSGERINGLLVEPGEALANDPLPEQQSSRMYEAHIRHIMSWQQISNDQVAMATLNTALQNNPAEPLNPGELQEYIDDQLTDFYARKRELELANAENWRSNQTEPVSDADFQAHIAEAQARAEKRMEDMIRAQMTEQLDVPYVVIADTNWGGNNYVLEFAIAPDPLTGELRIFVRDAISGNMRLQGANWDTAGWWVEQ